MSWREEHEAVAAAVLGGRPTQRGWIRRNCPICEMVKGTADRKRSFGYHVISRRFECFRCGGSGRLKDDPDDYSGYAVDEQAAMAPVLEPPEGFHELGSDVGRSSVVLAEAWAYLLRPVEQGGRGLTEEQVVRFKLGACATGKYGGRIIIPVLSKDGAWLWFVGRTWQKTSDKPYLYPSGGRGGVMFNHEAIHVPTDQPVAVVEGSFDAIGMFPHAVAVLGSPSDANILALEEAARPVVFVLDGDAHEQAWTYAMRLRLAGKRAGTVKLPPRVDPDEIPLPTLLGAMQHSLGVSEVAL